jgi:hypothetical protein
MPKVQIGSAASENGLNGSGSQKYNAMSVVQLIRLSRKKTDIRLTCACLPSTCMWKAAVIVQLRVC